MNGKKRSAFIISIFIIALYGAAIYTQEEKIRIAVAPFDDAVTAESEKERAGATAAAAARGIFAALDRFFVRDPGAIKDYLDSLVKVQVGLSNPDILKNRSGNLEVKYLTVGTVSKFEGLYDADTRTVNIDTWVIVHSHGATAPSLDEAMGIIGAAIKRVFTKEYLLEREKEDMDRPTVSVVNFSDFNPAAGVKGYAGAFSEILNSQIGAFALVSTVEGKYAKALLDEKILSMAGVTGNDDSSASLNIKGIQYKLTGDIRVFSDLICINYKLYNTSEGRIVFMGSKEIATRKGLRPAAWGISAEIEDVLNNRIGTLKLASVPAAADVFIDGSKAGTTPLVISLPGGAHALALKMAGYKTHDDTVEISANKIAEKSITLETVSLKLLMDALTFERLGKWSDAVDSYQKFIDSYKDSAESNNALYRKGHVLLVNLKDYGKALEAFQSLVNRYPDTMTRAEAYYGMIKTYIAMGEKEKAKESAGYLIKNYPEAYATEEAKKISF